MTKKRALIGLGVFILLAAGSSAVIAGYKSTNVVYVGSNAAYGAMGDARNAGDATQYIGCTFGAGYVYCAVRNSAGLTKTCVSYDASIIAAAGNLNGATFLQFAWDLSGYCTYVEPANYSHSRPMTP